MTSIASRFCFGALIPALAFAAMMFAVMATGGGKGATPAILFFGSFVAVPAVLLANQWTLFVRWRWRGSVLLAGLGLPALLALAAMLGTHGSGRVQATGFALWSPFIAAPIDTRSVQLLVLAWAVLLVTAFVAAAWWQRRRDARSRP